ncbi:hypothetical protein [Segniliparus rugosus]|uniref:Nitroreductase family deazaflavin-dependent oxidoreductase n=1 Tax=Segniliparus rugosus (strain ATCC BAA-974 / DSM 45345 / CCUG 50838 / CIP 108380 / JCM 13579 / CDC 945) TaxID=679197 RepID=E5XKX1_SEGRC|nr:hypothetical protein [Segniliparus rugosus]EFV14953.1 hypothetical protein HMPREF9336_00140 [Segniliparus rugosus ATCC BAA-974]
MAQFEKRAANPVLRLVAPHFGVIRHKGRKSGKAHATLITLVARDEVFSVNLGPRQGRDWRKNLASPGGMVRHRGADDLISSVEARPGGRALMPSAAKALVRAGSYVAVQPKGC